MTVSIQPGAQAGCVCFVAHNTIRLHARLVSFLGAAINIVTNLDTNPLLTQPTISIGLAGKQTCAQDKAECNLGVCANGSECKELSNGFACTCKKGGPWQGVRCDEDVNECKGDTSVCVKVSAGPVF